MKTFYFKNLLSLSFLVLVSFVLLVSKNYAQESVTTNPELETQEKQQAIIIEYQVQEGDTLSDLTLRYLDDPNLWRLNAEVNPELTNFNYLKPGSTIRLITGYEAIEPEVMAAQAKIEVIANEVGKSIQRSDWLDAKTGDELQPNDGVRTLEASSAVLIFIEDTGSESRVQMSENSRVFVSTEKEESGITRNEIEIEQGEAELNIDSSAVSDIDSLNEFEIIIGDVITKPILNAQGQLTTKARLADGDSSQIMVYSGNSEVASGGVSVDVETGMGTIAKSGEAPLPPEKLLDATTLNPNNPSEQIIGQTSKVSWEVITGAQNYKLELCKDTACAQVFRLEQGLTQTNRTLSDLPLGTSYWRVSGISPSGLDGFVSSTQSITVSEPLPEVEEKKLPWYVWLIILAYILYFIKTFIWYLNN